MLAAISRSKDGEIRVRSAELEHENVVNLEFVGDLGFAPGPQWTALKFRLKTPDASAFYETYMQPIALATAFSSLETSGELNLEIIGASSEIDQLSLHFEQIYVDDDEGRFSLYGLDGDIELHAGEQQRES